MRCIKNKYGFTLVEMIVVIAVAAVVLTPFGMLMTSALRNEVMINRMIDADQTTQQTFINLNEKIRKEGFSAVSVHDPYLTVNDVLRVDDKIFFLKMSGSDPVGYVYQDYVDGSFDSTSEVMLNEYVLTAVPTLVQYKDILHDDGVDTSGYTQKQLDEYVGLKVEFGIDTNDDDVVDDTYVYRYSKRD